MNLFANIVFVAWQFIIDTFFPLQGLNFIPRRILENVLRRLNSTRRQNFACTNENQRQWFWNANEFHMNEIRYLVNDIWIQSLLKLNVYKWIV